MTSLMTAGKYFSSLFLCLFFLALCPPAEAHDSEPINTEFASPLARGTANLNFDFQHLRHASEEAFAGADLEYGLAHGMQFSLGFPAMRRVVGPGQSVVGAGNMSLGFRYLVAGGNEKSFAVSINPEAEFPTGNPGATDPAYTAGAAVHVDAHRGDRLWLHSNLGYETTVASFDEKEKNFNFAIAGMYELTEKWHSVVELFGSHDFNAGLTELSVAPEMIYSLGKRWEIKAAVPLGASSSTPTVGVQVRVTWKLGHSMRQ